MQKYHQLMGYPEEFVTKLKRYTRFQVVLGPYRQSAAKGLDAQLNDLEFRRQMEGFREIDPIIADAVLNTWNRHVEFLGPEYSFLSLVSPKVSPQEKAKIAENIASTPDPRTLAPAPPKPSVPITATTQLHELATGPRVYLPFHLLGISAEFLTKDQKDWETDSDFERLSEFARNFRVVNDVVEHSVQLATDYNELITRDEMQRQCLYVGVNKRRKERSDLRRKTLQPSPPKKVKQPSLDRSHLKRS